MPISKRMTSIRLVVAGFALFGVLACSQADSAPTSDLERDLEATKMAEMEMANAGGKRTDIVSAAERIPTGAKTPATRAPAPKTSPDSALLAEIEGTPSTRPRAPEPPKPTRKGPYKSTSEVIRNAPFPINP
jgi:hypothetical protein